MRSIVIASSVAFLIPLATLASMPEETYDKARRTASLHLQLRIISVTRPEKTPGECKIGGEVAMIFRDNLAKIRKGDLINIDISCMASGDRILPGGASWVDVERLVAAKYLEVYLNRGARDTYEVALWQSMIIEAPTTEPRFPVSE